MENPPAGRSQVPAAALLPLPATVAIAAGIAERGPHPVQLRTYATCRPGRNLASGETTSSQASRITMTAATTAAAAPASHAAE